MAWPDRPGSGWLASWRRSRRSTSTTSDRLRAFWEVEQAAHARRPLAPGPATVRAARAACRGSTGARAGARCWRRTTATQLVGTADLGASTPRQPRTSPTLEVNVVPTTDGRGSAGLCTTRRPRAGRADGRTTFIGEAMPAGVARRVRRRRTRSPRALGFETGPPRGPPRPRPSRPPRSSRRRDRRRARSSPGPTARPDDLVAAYARMRTQMNHDVPTGELDHRAPRSMTASGARGGGAARPELRHGRRRRAAGRRRAGRIHAGVPASRRGLRPAGRHAS